MLKPITTTQLRFMRLKGSALAAHKAFCPADFGSPYGLPPKSSVRRLPSARIAHLGLGVATSHFLDDRETRRKKRS